MQQSSDFHEECDALAKCLLNVCADDWELVTQFKGWSLNDIIVHLHFWNEMADWSLSDEVKFQDRLSIAIQGIESGGLRPIENSIIPQRGVELFEIWQRFYSGMSKRWANLDPKLRVPWAGPDMSVRSSMTARQMETWAHGQAVFDVLGLERAEGDRIKNIVVLGVNTFGWSHKVQGIELPSVMPELVLEAPSGEIWTFGENEGGRISGMAVEFAQIVTQTRNVLDTNLTIEGDAASKWMATAQCFAGPAETPPLPGQRQMSWPH